MVGFLRKRKAPLLQVRFSSLSDSSTPPNLLSFFLRFCFCTTTTTTSSSSSSSSSQASSFTVSYLINSCGFSHRKAVSASKSVHFETPEKPDSVLGFFDTHGFSKSQTLKIVRKQPQLLVLSDTETSLLPKLQFFYSKGASKSDVVRIVASTPAILTQSLENKIIPLYDFFKDLFESAEIAMGVVKSFWRVVPFDLLRTRVETNINTFITFKIPKSNIAKFLKRHPTALMMDEEGFQDSLVIARGLSLDPSKMKFLLAFQAFRVMTKSTLNKKTNAYLKWWYVEEMCSAFLKSPACLLLSKGKFMATMRFFVDKMGKESSWMAGRPALLLLSLEKRIIPRYSVVEVLLSKGLITKDFSLSAVFQSTENMFLQKFVNPYEEEAPQLLNLYQKKVRISEKKQGSRLMSWRRGRGSRISKKHRGWWELPPIY